MRLALVWVAGTNCVAFNLGTCFAVYTRCQTVSDELVAADQVVSNLSSNMYANISVYVSNEKAGDL